MGRRSATETVGAVFLALLQQRTWSQAALARHVGVTTKALRSCLTDLERSGLPLERSTDPPHVYWSVPANWIPGVVAFSSDEARSLARMIARHARTPERDAIMKRLLESLPALRARTAREQDLSALEQGLVPTRAGAEPHLHTVEDATSKRSVLVLEYFSASRGNLGMRELSPVKVFIGPPARFLALCHRSGKLKWFRVDNIHSARPHPDRTFRHVSHDVIDQVVAASLNGFHGGEEAIEWRALVREPEARWVKANLPDATSLQELDDGIALVGRTSGLLPLARFLVGLGEAVTVETPELRRLVEALARGALRLTKPPAKTTPPTSKRRAG